MPDNGFTLRQATPSDLADIAAIHLKAYSRSHFTSRLSHDILMRYYSLFFTDFTDVILACDRIDSTEKIIGFAVFGRNISDIIGKFKKESWFDILKASARHPFAATGKIIQKLWVRATEKTSVKSTDYILLSIAVASSGRGAGGLLLDAFLEEAKRNGMIAAGLYVNADNIGAINAYISRGFVLRDLYGGQYYMERPVKDSPESLSAASPMWEQE